MHNKKKWQRQKGKAKNSKKKLYSEMTKKKIFSIFKCVLYCLLQYLLNTTINTQHFESCKSWIFHQRNQSVIFCINLSFIIRPFLMTPVIQIPKYT